MLELFSGVGAGTQALVRLGYQLGEVIACERRGAARQVHAEALQRLAAEFPDRLSRKAGARLHHLLPQDIRLVTKEQLRELGPIDIVIAGWPCQGSSAAGAGRGLDNERSGLFLDLLRVLLELQQIHRGWNRPLGHV